MLRVFHELLLAIKNNLSANKGGPFDLKSLFESCSEQLPAPTLVSAQDQKHLASTSANFWQSPRKDKETYEKKRLRTIKEITYPDGKTVKKNQRVLADTNKDILTLYQLLTHPEEERTNAFWKSFIKEAKTERKAIYPAASG
jgi:hypothetical protein